MGPLIDAALEKVDRRHAQLTQLSSDLVDALNLYHTLMREPPASSTGNYTLPKLPVSQMSGSYHQYQNQGGPAPPPLVNESRSPPISAPPIDSLTAPTINCPQMYNGMPQQPSFNAGAMPVGVYQPGVPSSGEYMAPGSMGAVNLPRFHMPPGPPPSGHPQGLAQPPSDRPSLPFQQQG